MFKPRNVLKLGDNWQVECLVAIGERGDKSSPPYLRH